MRIALTGATGFVGRAVATRLAGAGHELRALVRPGSKSPEQVEAVSGALDDERALQQLVDGMDAVVHVAGRISALTRAEFFETNEAGTRRLAQAAAAAKVGRFVHISSLSARRPELSAYGASKAAGEAALAAHGGSMRSLVIRPPAVYGPGDTATLPLVKALTGNPVVLAGSSASRFSLIHVGDLARIVMEAVTSDRVGIVEVDDGRAGGYGWHDLVEAAGEMQGRRLKAYFLPKSLCMAIAGAVEMTAMLRGKPGMMSRDKIRELYAEDWVARAPGWPLASPTGFQPGFAATLDWYRNAGWLPPPRKAMVAPKRRT